MKLFIKISIDKSKNVCYNFPNPTECVCAIDTLRRTLWQGWSKWLRWWYDGRVGSGQIKREEVKTMEHFENNYVFGYYESIYGDGQFKFKMYVQSQNGRVQGIDQLIGMVQCPHCGKPMHIFNMAFGKDKKRAVYLCKGDYGCFKTTEISLIEGARLAWHLIKSTAHPCVGGALVFINISKTCLSQWVYFANWSYIGR